MFKKYITDVIKNQALSNHDMEERGVRNIKLYDEFEQCRDLTDVFDGEDHCVILYQSKNASNGHWCLLLDHGESVEFFDSYGKKPDHWIPKSYNQQYPFLYEMIINDPRKCYYNDVAYQNIKCPSTATCGKWCLLRFMFREMTLEHFNKCFHNKKITLSSDDLVSILI